MQMDQHAQYLMWMKSKDLMIMNSFNHSKMSWEEQAFADDARGPLGGFIWPPRSYSCSFCKREFRSAQALGGHMNVHRRERARLKQSDNPSPNSHPQSSTLSKSLDLESSISNPIFVVASSSLSPSSRVLPVLGHGISLLDCHDPDQNGVEKNLFVDGLNLDLWGNCSNRVNVDDEEMDGIDLELRLGDSPKMK